MEEYRWLLVRLSAKRSAELLSFAGSYDGITDVRKVRRSQQTFHNIYYLLAQNPASPDAARPRNPAENKDG